MKLCKDCKYVQPDSFWWISRKRWEFATCERETPSLTPHPVDGALIKPRSSSQFCRDERKSNWEDRCGPDAKFWEEKPTKTWFALNITSR